MAGTSIGTAWIQIKPSLKGITNDLKQELAGAETAATSSSNKITGIFSGLGSNLKTVFSGVGKVAMGTFAAAGTAATAAFAGIGKSALTAYADWEQLYGGIETLFGDALDTVDNYAQKAYRTAGLSANEYMEMATDFSASLLQSLGNDTAKAAEYANDAIIDMSDNANKMGTSIESIQDAYRGFSKQNYTMLDNLKLGYGGTKTEMERLLADAEKLSGTKFSIDSFADITKAIHVIQDFRKITNTTAEEAEGTISGSLNMVKASWKNLLAFMGGGTTMAWNDIFPAFVSSIKTAATNLEPAIHDIVSNIGNLFGELAPILVGVLPDLVSSIISMLTSIIPPVLEVLPDIIGALVDGIVDFISNADNVTTIIDGFVKLFVAVAAGAGRIVTAIIPLLPEIVGQIVNSLGEEFAKPENTEPILAGFGLLVGSTVLKTVGTNLLSGLKEHIGNPFSKFFKKNIGTDVANEASSSVSKVGSSLASKITNLGNTISSAFKALGDILGSVVGTVLEPIKVAFKGIGEAVAGFFKAFADPMIAVGAAMFTVAAAAIAAAVLLIGAAIGVVMPTITTLFNEVLMPLATFIAETVLLTITTLTDLMINLTNSALIPLGEFMTGSFIAIIDAVTASIVNLTQGAVIPLLETLSGTFTNVLNSVSGLITGTLNAALGGIANIIEKVSDGFTKMGEAIRNALNGVNGILSTFRDMIMSIADAIVAVVALATGQSIDYGTGFAHISKAAMGGCVEGIGTDTSDSNLYALSKGEYVIRAAAARRAGYDNLDQLNETGSMNSGNTYNVSISIDGYNKDPEELANIISRKIALKTQGVY